MKKLDAWLYAQLSNPWVRYPFYAGVLLADIWWVAYWASPWVVGLAWLFLGAQITVILFDTANTRRQRRYKCSCGHTITAHPNPKECLVCNCDDYDGRVPAL